MDIFGAGSIFIKAVKYFAVTSGVILFVFDSSAAPVKKATQLKSGCFLDESATEVKQLPKLKDEKLPIASVSKLFTSLMATTRYQIGAKSPFATQIFVFQTAAKKFHVHIKGSDDPYFNRFKMHRIISMLNQVKVVNIERLTFDEKVKLILDTDSRGGFYVQLGRDPKTGKNRRELVRPLILKADLDYPRTELVRAQLLDRNQLLKDYAKSLKAAKASGIEMVATPKIQVSKIEFVHSSTFVEATPMTKFYVESQTVATMLKMMNWNSNNFSSNRIYMGAGGHDGFQELFFEKYRVSRDDLEFVNGSGQNHALNGEGRIYNESTCAVVAKTVRALNKSVKAQSKDLTDIMSVVGLDVGSTVGGATYSNPTTKGKVVAKTGTIGTNVTLAGAINTKSGLRYFMFNVELAAPGTSSENRARKIISQKLTDLVKQTPNVVAFDYQTTTGKFDQLGFEEYDEEASEEPSVGPAIELVDPVIESGSLTQFDLGIANPAP